MNPSQMANQATSITKLVHLLQSWMVRCPDGGMLSSGDAPDGTQAAGANGAMDLDVDLSPGTLRILGESWPLVTRTDIFSDVSAAATAGVLSGIAFGATSGVEVKIALVGYFSQATSMTLWLNHVAGTVAPTGTATVPTDDEITASLGLYTWCRISNITAIRTGDTSAPAVTYDNFSWRPSSQIVDAGGLDLTSV